VLYSAQVTIPLAEVRCGPGDTPQLYVTSQLHRGDAVKVVKEAEGGWVAIKPPAGSFDWINMRFVNQTKPGSAMWYVVAFVGTKVPLLAGSSVSSATTKPTVEAFRVSRGQQLKAVGGKMPSDDGFWLSVEPVETEVRYIRADAISRQPNQTTSTITPPGINPDGPPGVVTPPPPVAGASTSVDPRWQSAEDAERKGNYSEAIMKYRQLANETVNSDHELSLRASNQAQRLTDALSVRPPASVGNTAGAQSGLPAGWIRSGAGWLRRAGRSYDANPLYVLENSQGMPIIYAIAQPGYTLAPYENRNVDLIGPSGYNGGLRANRMTVMQVQPLR
jgi:hypothetical protein